jgi:signal transduction histidine kinase
LQLGSIVERDRAEAALVAAKQNAERAAAVARQAMAEAQAADRAKTEFLANMSHELRTPLNAIIGFSEMMVSGIPSLNRPEKQTEYARDIHESGCHLLDVINDILDLAKIEAGKAELHEQEVDLVKVVHACMRLIHERAGENGLRLQCRVPQEALLLIADEVKLKQILINLLSNAVKFTPRGGMVVLVAEVEPDHGLAVRVSDTGIGIAAADIPKILKAFVQIESHLSRVYEGTGLGLALSKALAELHGGSLNIDSEVGVGTTVTLRLPAERVTGATAPAMATGDGGVPARLEETPNRCVKETA